MEEVLTRVRDCVWEVPTSYKKGMRVPGRIFLNDVAIKELEQGAVDQVANVACLPGIQKVFYWFTRHSLWLWI